MNLIPEAEGRTPFYLDPARIWRQLPPAERLSFISALLIGSVTHLFVLSNLLPNHDAAISLISVNSHLNLGRWSLSFFSAFSWLYEMPVVIGLLSLLALALSALLAVRFLEIHSPVCVILVSGFLVAFLPAAGIFSYMYTADAYFFSLLLNIAAVVLARKRRWGWPASILCIAVGLGIYQSFIGCAVALFLFDCILALFSNLPTKTILKRGIYYILILIGALLLYRVFLAYFLWKYDVSLSNYRGMTDAMNSGLMGYLHALPETWKQPVRYFWQHHHLTDYSAIFQKVMLVLAAGGFIFLTAVKRLYKAPVRLLLLALGVLLMPIALNLIYLIGAGQTMVTLLMQYPYVFVYVFAVKIFEMTARETSEYLTGIFRNGAALTGLLLCFMLVWANFCLCNQAYLALHLTYESTYSAAVRVAAKLDETEGYIPGETPVLLAGFFETNQKLSRFMPQLAYTNGIANYAMLSDYSGYEFLRRFCGAEPLLAASSEQTALVETSGILDEMPAFPLKGCVQLYNGIAVVKLS